MEIDAFLDSELGAKKKVSEDELPEDVKKALMAEPEKITSTESKLEKKKPEAKKLGLKAPEEKAVKEVREKAEEDIDRMISEANKLISKGDFEGARKVYLKIKEMKKDLPQKFMNEEEKMSKSLLVLNEQLVQGMDKTLSTEFNERFSKINNLLDEAYTTIHNSIISNEEDLAKVELIYHKIKKTYSILPEGFIEKKVMVQDQMLKLYKIMIINKKNLLSYEFRKKSEQIVKLMQDIAYEINKNKLENASKLFSRTTQIYSKLPKGFLNEKTKLQSKILDIYQKLVLGRESISYNMFESKSAQIKKLFLNAYSFIKKNRLKEAMKTYSSIAELYSSLPAGYHSKKADLDIGMMELNHLISLKKDKELLVETKAKIDEIDLLLESSKNYMINKEYDLAKQVYDEVVEIYNSLPEGFLDQNVKVQNRIIKLYKALLAHMHEPLVAEITKEEKIRYEELIKLLVDIHRHIKKKEFKEIKGKYLAAYRLYHELPIGIIEEKKHLYKEIYRTYEELRIYTSMEKLAEYAEKNEYDKLEELLNLTADEHNTLSKKYPQDIELFKYIQAKCLFYHEMLSRKKTKKVMAKKETSADVKKKIEAVVNKKKELGTKLPVQTKPADKHEKEGTTSNVKSYLKKKYDIKG